MKAQGALEYLIIIAAVLGISAVVVMFVTGAFTSTSSGADLTKCRLAAANCEKDLKLGVSTSCDYCEDACIDANGNDLISGVPGCGEACLLCKEGTTVSSMTGHWKFDEGTGATTYDSSGNGNDAQIVSGLTWDTNCKVGACLTTTSTSNSLRIPSSDSLNTGDYFTFAGWFKPSGTFSQVYTFYMRNYQSGTVGYHFIYMVGSASGIVYQYADGVNWRVVSTPSMNWAAGTWYHIAVTHNKQTKNISFYRDGLFNFSWVYTGDALSVTDGIAYIGSYRSSYHFFMGTMDEIRTYARILSDDEIFALNKSGI